MTKIIMIWAVAICCIVRVAAQAVVSVPQVVADAFHARFPNAARQKWEKENATEYECEFHNGKTEMSAKYDQSGKWLETETEVKVTDLPPAVLEVIIQQYKDYKLKEAEVVETQEGKLYEAELSKGGKVTELRLSADGRVVSTHQGD
ncbi:MAG: PepSY-like domain-containing protein [Bacteroidetes bacterium]|nr:PepSY-like domain-containing protein [Bacteroidota bacterium]